MNLRLEVLLDREHQIGHSYLIEVKNLTDLKVVFQDKIIPLLQEYFYGDYSKIGMVLGKGFVKIKSNHTDKPFADFENDFEIDNRSLYELINVNDMDDDTFLKAISNFGLDTQEMTEEKDNKAEKEVYETV